MNTVKINRKDLPSKSDTPAFDYCRKLLKEGVDPKTRLEIYRNRDTWDYAIESIGEGAKWSVDHNVVVPYRKSHLRKDLKGAQDARQASRSDLNE